MTPVVERVGIDEAFLDVSGARRRLGATRRHRPPDLTREIHAAARRLFAGVAIGESGVRLLGVRIDNLVGVSGAALQDAFDDLEAPDWRGAECAMDRVRSRYGAAAAIPGSLVRSPATAATIRDLS